MHGCKPGGKVDESDFSRPLPWIGVYVAFFSILCAALMGFDLVEGFRRPIRWFPCRSFSLNAASLTFLAIAVKFPLDINTAMPSRWDQLSKLTGTVLLGVVMGNIMPSLGVTDNVLSNTIALTILVITVVANVATQIGTGVIFSFHPEHYIVLSLLLILLAITISSALIVPTTKKVIDGEYEKLADQAEKPGFDHQQLAAFVAQQWLMAHTGSPQNVLGRSTNCIASGLLCLLSVAVLIVAVCRSFIPESRTFCDGNSDYEWSTAVVVLSQLVTVAVGTVAPVGRCLGAVGFYGKRIRVWNVLSLEKYWFHMLIRRRESRLEPWIDGRWFRKAGLILRNSLLLLIIAMQAIVVVFCKLLALIVGLVLRSICFCYSGNSNSNPQDDDDLRRFVLHLEGEDQLIDLLEKVGRRESEKSIQNGLDRPPDLLIALIENHSSVGFQKIGRCVICSADEGTQYCWALTLVTLTSIALAIPGMDEEKKALRRSVNEGLRYVRLVDKHLDHHGLVMSAEAADDLWDQVDLFGRWFDTKLCIRDETDTGKLLTRLENMGSSEMRGGNDAGESDPQNSTPRSLAGESMKTIAGAVRVGDGIIDLNRRGLFLWLRGAIADVLGACLTNIPQVVWMECVCSNLEDREERVREAALLLGECKKLLGTLGRKMPADGAPGEKQRPSLSEWVSRQDPNISRSGSV